jgi:glycerol uptake facilitator-like aquaporin
MYTPAFVEFLGTAFFVGTFAFTKTPLLALAALATAIALGGKISGGHFNPAITAWSLASGKIGKAKALSYFIAQIAAALMIWVFGSLVKV